MHAFLGERAAMLVDMRTWIAAQLVRLQDEEIQLEEALKAEIKSNPTGPNNNNLNGVDGESRSASPKMMNIYSSGGKYPKKPRKTTNAFKNESMQD